MREISEIKKFKLGDEPALMEICERWHEEYGFWTYKQVRDALAQPNVFVTYQHELKDANRWAVAAIFEHAADQCDLIYIYVLPAWRRQGLAKDHLLACMTHFYEKFQVGKLFLEVRPGNKPALALYQQLGMKEVGFRKAYYSNGDDALVLCWDYQEGKP